MDYVPFGEKAISLTINLYMKTANEIPVIEGNVLQSLLEVSIRDVSYIVTNLKLIRDILW